MSKPVYTVKAQSLDGKVSWEVIIPRFSLGPPRKRKFSFFIQFRMKNNSEKQLILHTQVHSLTPLLRFQSVKILGIKKARIWEKQKATTAVIKRTAAPKEEIIFQFQAMYNSSLPQQPMVSTRIEYVVSAFDEEGNIITHSDPHQILIPLVRKKK